MASNVVINGITYQNVPQVDIPRSDSGTASFYDTEDATLSSGDQLLDGVTGYSKGVKYTGNIATKTGADLTASGATVSVPAGYYASATTKSVDSGSVTAPSTISGTSASVSTGTNTLTLTKSVSVTPTVSTPGYVSAGTAGTSSVSLTATVTTKGAETITPGTSNKTIASGTYLTGTQTIAGDSNLQAQYIKSGISIFGVNGGLTAATVSQDATTKVLSIS